MYLRKFKYCKCRSTFVVIEISQQRYYLNEKKNHLKSEIDITVQLLNNCWAAKGTVARIGITKLAVFWGCSHQLSYSILHVSTACINIINTGAQDTTSSNKLYRQNLDALAMSPALATIFDLYLRGIHAPRDRDRTNQSASFNQINTSYRRSISISSLRVSGCCRCSMDLKWHFENVSTFFIYSHRIRQAQAANNMRARNT